jgi:hypothetical protein
MESILQGITYEVCLVCLDDVIIAGQMLYQKLDNLRKLFQGFQMAHFKPNPKKS